MQLRRGPYALFTLDSPRTLFALSSTSFVFSLIASRMAVLIPHPMTQSQACHSCTHGSTVFAMHLRNEVSLSALFLSPFIPAQLDAAQVIQAGLFSCGVSSILHILFGSRLPLLQATTLTFLAPAMAIALQPANLALPDDQASDRGWALPQWTVRTLRSASDSHVTDLCLKKADAHLMFS